MSTMVPVLLSLLLLMGLANTQNDAPSVSFISQEGPGNSRTLKCLADNFYPRPVSMYWTQSDSPLETDEWGDIILREDGTYNSWVTVKVPSSDTGPYFCNVQHSSLGQLLTVPWNEGQESGAERPPSLQTSNHLSVLWDKREVCWRKTVIAISRAQRSSEGDTQVVDLETPGLQAGH